MFATAQFSALALITLLFPSTGDPWTATLEGKLTASPSLPLEGTGYSVSLSGTTALVGVPWADLPSGQGGVGAGKALMFERDSLGVWNAAAELSASDAAPGDFFGFAVALSGDLAVVGAFDDDFQGGPLAEGSVYVFERDQGGPGAWGQTAKLVASDAEDNDRFGYSVAVSGDLIVVGADAEGNYNGAAYVFERSGPGGGWTEVAQLQGNGGSFGLSVAASGDTVLIGARGDDSAGVNAGAAFVFGRDQGGPGAWGEVVKLTASDGSTGTAESFGISVALDVDTAVIGAHRNSEVASHAGAAYVFEREPSGSGTWTEVTKLTASDAWFRDLFGFSVAISGDLVVVGAVEETHAPFVPGGALGEGSAYVFERDRGGPDSWGEAVKLVAYDAEAGDWFGLSVALSDERVFVGAPKNDQAGAAYAYDLSFGSETYCTAGVSRIGCRAFLTATGTASATASSGFTLSASFVEGGRTGLFYFGTSGRQANPWGSGTSFQCVIPPVQRAGTLTAPGTSGLCDGVIAQDFNALWCPSCPKPGKNPGAGARVQVQLWYRDPLSTSNQTTSLSDAFEFAVMP